MYFFCSLKTRDTVYDVNNGEEQDVGSNIDDDESLELQDDEKNQGNPDEGDTDTTTESTKERTKKSKTTDKDDALKDKKQKPLQPNETVQKAKKKNNTKNSTSKKEKQATKKAAKVIQNLLIERIKHIHKIKNLENDIQKSNSELESLKHKYQIKTIKDSVKNGSLLDKLKKGDYKGIIAKSVELPVVSKKQENAKSTDKIERLKDRAYNSKWLRGQSKTLRGRINPMVYGESQFKKRILIRKFGKQHYLKDLRRRKLLAKVKNQVRTHSFLQEKITKKALIKLKKAIQRVLFMIAKKERRLKAGKSLQRIPPKLRKLLMKNTIKKQNKKN